MYVKRLASNDNSKNQVYFGPDFQALNLLPNEGVTAEPGRADKPHLKAKLRFGWLQESGNVSPAPSAQLILYPQYPEVRFSGFLQGVQNGPSTLMSSRERARALFLGVTSDGRVIGYVAGAASNISHELAAESGTTHGVFLELSLPGKLDTTTSRSRLLSELRRIHLLGWIDSKQLDSRGRLSGCTAPQCGGFTLEAELGISKNSDADPDYLGWEVKQHGVSSFSGTAVGGPITLMTPEPTGGVYKDKGAREFIRRFGYADKLGRRDRWNFGGVHKVGLLHPTTNLTLQFQGFDPKEGRLRALDASLALVTTKGEVAASWSLAGLIAHWSKKHAKAVYVPSRCRTDPQRQYQYGKRVRLAEGNDPLRLLKAFAGGVVYYDPGIKLEGIGPAGKVKKRSQFRIGSKNISSLYASVDTVDVLAGG